MATDTGRKDLSDKIADTIQPDHSKSTTERIGDNVTGKSDKLARDAVPDSQKSTSQSLQDKLSRETDHHSTDHTTTGHTTTGHHTTGHHTGEHESVIDKVKHAFGADKH